MTHPGGVFAMAEGFTHLRANVASAGLEIPPDALAELDAIAL